MREDKTMYNPYTLLKEEDDENNFINYMLVTTSDGMVKICRENVFKVNAMIRSNSSYKRTIRVDSIPILKAKEVDKKINAIRDASLKMKNGEFFEGP